MSTFQFSRNTRASRNAPAHQLISRFLAFRFGILSLLRTAWQQSVQLYKKCFFRSTTQLELSPECRETLNILGSIATGDSLLQHRGMEKLKQTPKRTIYELEQLQKNVAHSSTKKLTAESSKAEKALLKSAVSHTIRSEDDAKVAALCIFFSEARVCSTFIPTTLSGFLLQASEQQRRLAIWTLLTIAQRGYPEAKQVIDALLSCAIGRHLRFNDIGKASLPSRETVVLYIAEVFVILGQRDRFRRTLILQTLASSLRNASLESAPIIGRLLGRMGPELDAAMPILRSIFLEENARLAIQVCQVIAACRHIDEETRDMFIRTIRHPSSEMPKRFALEAGRALASTHKFHREIAHCLFWLLSIQGQEPRHLERTVPGTPLADAPASGDSEDEVLGLPPSPWRVEALEGASMLVSLAQRDAEAFDSIANISINCMRVSSELSSSTRIGIGLTASLLKDVAQETLFGDRSVQKLHELQAECDLFFLLEQDPHVPAEIGRMMLLKEARSSSVP